jgi:uncharacterized membrane protein (DUF4010 family)
VAAAAYAGFADTHSAAVSVASLVAANRITASEARIPILVGLTTNTATKAIVAAWIGGLRFALQTIPGLVLMLVGSLDRIRFRSRPSNTESLSSLKRKLRHCWI